MKQLIRLMRPKHYIKNLLIFVPVFFSQNLLDAKLFFRTLTGFIAFCLVASAVYIFNDIHDVEEDRRHPLKKDRPIASGAISIKAGYMLAIGLVVVAIGLNVIYFSSNRNCIFVLLTYGVVNLGYSLGLKHIPFLDIALLVSGFFLRVLYGAVIIDVQVSSWVSLTVITLSIYLGLGKRRNELIKTEGKQKTRPVLRYYTTAFCDKFMQTCMTCALVFYALWAADGETAARIGNNYLVWTVPLVFFILMKYCADIESDSFGDPVEVVLHDQVLIILCLIFGVAVLGIVYLPRLW